MTRVSMRSLNRTLLLLWPFLLFMLLLLFILPLLPLTNVDVVDDTEVSGEVDVEETTIPLNDAFVVGRVFFITPFRFRVRCSCCDVDGVAVD
jgi:hypothetical protein